MSKLQKKKKKRVPRLGLNMVAPWGYHVGSYYLMGILTDVYLDIYSCDSSVHYPNKSKGVLLPQMVLGVFGLCDTGSWHSVYESLLHETIEWCMHRGGQSYEVVDAHQSSCDARFFFMNHVQFGECCAAAADFMCGIMADLIDVCRKLKKGAR